MNRTECGLDIGDGIGLCIACKMARAERKEGEGARSPHRFSVEERNAFLLKSGIAITGAVLLMVLLITVFGSDGASTGGSSSAAGSAGSGFISLFANLAGGKPDMWIGGFNLRQRQSGGGRLLGGGGNMAGVETCHGWASSSPTGRSLPVGISVGDAPTNWSSENVWDTDFEYACCPTERRGCSSYRAHRLEPWSGRGNEPEVNVCCYQPANPGEPEAFPCVWDTKRSVCGAGQR